MSLLEQLAFAVLSLAAALREIRRPAAWAPWLPVFGLSLLAVLALAWAAHPALSWVIAPLLAACGRTDALHYPALYRQMPELLGPVGIALGALVVPFASGAATLAFASAYRGGRPRLAGAMRETMRRWPALVLATSPVVLARLALLALAGGLGTVRISNATRALLPGAGELALLLVRAACFYAVAEVMLERRGGLRALAAVPGSLARGFAGALLALALAGLPALFLGAIAGGPLAAFSARVPETAALLALARAALDAAAGALLAGAATMIHMGAVAAREDA